MKDSLKKFYEYVGSEENLMYYVRINVRWNEEVFLKMKKVIREVMNDYENEDHYPKRFVMYFILEIPSVINMLSHWKTGSQEDMLPGETYTEEKFLSMIAERIKQLEELRKEFIQSLWHYGNPNE